MNNALKGTLALSALILFVILVVSPTLAQQGSVYMCVYGSSGCPACRSLKSFFERYYPGNFYFCDISSSDSCFNGLMRLAANVTGVGYIPQTVVLKSDRVLAIVVGAVTDRGFWDELMQSTPVDGVPVYGPVDGELKLLGYVQVNEPDETFVSQYVACPHVTTTPKPSAASALNFALIAAVAAVVLVAGVVVMKLRPRR